MKNLILILLILGWPDWFGSFEELRFGAAVSV